MKRKNPVLAGRAAKLLDPFRLKMTDVPGEVPYLVDNALNLPDKLTSEEIHKIGAAARILDCNGFSLGDMLVWLHEHPDAPITHEEFVKTLLYTGVSRRTLYNYQSLSKSFPPSDRLLGLSRPHHDKVRGLKPKDEQQRLLHEALERGWPAKETGMRARIRRQELAMPRGGGDNHSLLRGQALLALKRCQLRNDSIVRLLSKPSLTTEEAAGLARESAALFKEMGDVENLLKQC
jgi:hypothetical protein